MNTRCCPECGSQQIGRAIYGMTAAPAHDDDTAYYVGCVIEGDSRRYGCHECGATFDRPAVASPVIPR